MILVNVMKKSVYFFIAITFNENDAIQITEKKGKTESISCFRSS